MNNLIEFKGFAGFLGKMQLLPLGVLRESVLAQIRSPITITEYPTIDVLAVRIVVVLHVYTG